MSAVGNKIDVEDLTSRLYDHGYELINVLGSGGVGMVVTALPFEGGIKQFAVKAALKTELDQHDRDLLLRQTTALLPDYAGMLTENDPQNLELLWKFKGRDYVSHLIKHFEDDDFFYFVYPLHEGGTLYDRLSRYPAGMNQHNALDIVHQIFLGIEYLHAKGIYHRDIKFENIVFQTLPSDEIQKISLIDFDVIHCRHSNQDSTYIEGTCGTIYYQSPQIIQELSYSPEKADIYAVGVVFYGLLCSSLPFMAEEEDSLIQQILNNPPNTSRAEFFQVNPDVKALIEDLLAKDEDSRPTARKARERIEKLQKAIPANSSESVPILSPRTALTKSPNFNLGRRLPKTNRKFARKPDANLEDIMHLEIDDGIDQVDSPVMSTKSIKSKKFAMRSIMTPRAKANGKLEYQKSKRFEPASAREFNCYPLEEVLEPAKPGLRHSSLIRFNHAIEIRHVSNPEIKEKDDSNISSLTMTERSLGMTGQLNIEILPDDSQRSAVRKFKSLTLSVPSNNGSTAKKKFWKSLISLRQVPENSG